MNICDHSAKHKFNNLANFHTPLSYGHNGHRGLIIAQDSTISGDCSPIHIVIKIIELCDYMVATNSKSMIHNWIFYFILGTQFLCILQECVYWQHNSYTF